MNFLQTTLNNLGHGQIGKACGVSRQAVKQWWWSGKLPDTEWLDPKHPRRTDYASIIAKMAKCKRSELL